MSQAEESSPSVQLTTNIPVINVKLLPPYATALSVFLTYIIALTIGAIVLRNNPEIKKRNIFLILIISGSNILLCSLYYVRNWYNDFPCLLSLWINYIGLPACLLAQVFSGIRIIFLHKFNDLKITKIDNSNLHITGENGMGPQCAADFEKQKSNVSRSNIQPPVFTRYKKMFTDRNMSILMAIVLILMVLFCVFTQISLGWWDKTPRTEGKKGCPTTGAVYKIPLIVFRCIILYVINPLLIYISRGMNDIFALRPQLIVSQLINGFLNFAGLVYDLYFVEKKIITSPSTGEIWLMGIAIVDFTFFVVIPVFRAARQTYGIYGHYNRSNSETNESQNFVRNFNSGETEAYLRQYQQKFEYTPSIFYLISKLRVLGTKHQPNWRPHNTEISFERVLGNAYYRNALLQVAVKSFCPENIMFVYAYIVLWQFQTTDNMRMQNNDSGCSGGGSQGVPFPWMKGFTMSSDPVNGILANLYQEVYENFFVSGGDFELSISSKLKTVVSNAFALNKVTRDVFDETYQSILAVLFETTHKQLCYEFK